MSLLHYYILNFLSVSLYFKESLCFCESSHVVICDDLSDVKLNRNDSSAWKYLQVGSSEYSNQLPDEVLDSNFTFKLPGIKSLTIIGRLNFIKTPPFLQRSKVEYLNLYGNNIIEIDDYSFGNLKTLREVYLENNKIQHLGRAVFINTTLDVVSLSRNEIRSITTGFYYSKIKSIKLNHNRISFVKNQAFPNELEQLELNYNHLESLESGVFENLKNLKEIYLEHNAFTTVPNISALTNIQYLHFGYNKIQEVHYRFDDHQKIEFIDFTSNSIRNITIDVFTARKIPPLVLLPMNRITKLVLQHPEKKTDVFVHGNPLNCDCLFQFEKTLRRYNSDMKTCDIKLFDQGKAPLCIDNGKCGLADIGKEEIDRFLEAVRVYEAEFKECVFRL